MKGTAFTAITGKNVYIWIGEAPQASDLKAYDFLGSNSTDTTFLINNGIPIVYTRAFDFNQNKNIKHDVNNPDLVEVSKGIYLLKQPEVRRGAIIVS